MIRDPNKKDIGDKNLSLNSGFMYILIFVIIGILLSNLSKKENRVLIIAFFFSIGAIFYISDLQTPSEIINWEKTELQQILVWILVFIILILSLFQNKKIIKYLKKKSK